MDHRVLQFMAALKEQLSEERAKALILISPNSWLS